MERIRRFSRRWLWLYIAAWLAHALELLFALVLKIPPTDQHLSYQLIFTINRLSLLFVVLAAISSIALYVIGTRDYFRAVMLFLITFVLMIFAFAILSPMPYSISRIASGSLEGHQFDLAAYTVNEPESAGDKRFTEARVFILYQCDSWDITCSSVFSRAYEARDGFFPPDAEAVLSAESGVMSLQIEGEVVYTSEAAA